MSRAQPFRRILLAEDDPRDVELTLEALARHHLLNKVDVVVDGEQALDYLYRRGAHARRPAAHPVVILLDLRMPKIDGLDVLRQVKADPQLRVIPVVVLTASREECDVVASYNLGTNAYIVKPISFPEFLQAVAELGAFWALLNEPPPDGFGAPQTLR
jgi:CheY-like chemotaxis protein